MSSLTLVTRSGSSLGRNLANVLTSVRLALALPVAVLLLAGSRADLALAALLVAIAALTDFLDGRVARRLGRVSTLGCFLDPLADKFVIDASIAALTLAHGFPAGVALLFIGRDIAVTVLRLTRSAQPAVLAPQGMAKVKTCALYVGVVGLILGQVRPGPIVSGSWLLIGMAAILSIISAVRYLRSALSVQPSGRYQR